MSDFEPAMTDIKNPVYPGDVEIIVSGAISGLRDDVRDDPKAFFGKFDPSVTSGSLLQLIDDRRFRTASLSIINGAVQNKSVMGFDKQKPTSVDEVIAFVYEFFRRVFFHLLNERADGSNYAYGHLAGTDENLLKMGLCSISTLIAGICHDDLEKDVVEIYPTFEPTDLLAPHLYSHRFSGDLDDERLLAMNNTIYQLADGVTKIKLIDETFLNNPEFEMFLDTDDATLFKLFESTVRNLRTSFLKLGDRGHNMSTIFAFRDNPEKMERIALQTEMVYASLAEILGLIAQRRSLIRDVSKVRNPPLYEWIKALVKRKLNRVNSIGVVRFLSDTLHDGYGKVPIEIRPFGLSDCVPHFGKDGVAGIKPDDLRISDSNPMAEVVVLVPTEGDIRSVADRIPSLLGMTSCAISDSDEGSLSDYGPAVADQRAAQVKNLVYRGVTIGGFSRKFGGHLRIRVVDPKNDHLSRRGILAFRHSDPEPRGMMETVDQLVAEKREKGRAVHTVDLAKEKLLYQRTYFSTPNIDIVDLPLGSTYLDAANAVRAKGSDLLIGLQTVRVQSSSLSLRHNGPVDPFEPLPLVTADDTKPVLFFDSCLDRKTGWDRSRIKVDPCWLLFCKQASTKQSISRYLQDPDQYLHPEVERSHLLGEVEHDNAREAVLANGRAFFDRMSAVLDIDVLKFMADKLTNRRMQSIDDTMNAMLYDVGTGKIDIFSKFMELVRPAKFFTIETDVSDQPKVILQFLPYFGDAGLSVRPVKPRNKEGHDLFRFEVAYPGAQEELNFEELLKILLRISYKHGVKIIGGLKLDRKRL